MYYVTSFVLNTSVELPHEKGVNALKFRPKPPLGGQGQFVITVGKDEKFKIWQLVEASTLDGLFFLQLKFQNLFGHWTITFLICRSKKVLEMLQCRILRSQVGPRCWFFFRWLTCRSRLWQHSDTVVDGNQRSKELFEPRSLSSTYNVILISLHLCPCWLKFITYAQIFASSRIEFGKHSNECIHLVVAASNEHMAIWDLLSLTMKWSVPINLAILTSDPFSDYMAAFTTDNTREYFHFISNKKSLMTVYERRLITTHHS